MKIKLFGDNILRNYLSNESVAAAHRTYLGLGDS